MNCFTKIFLLMFVIMGLTLVGFFIDDALSAKHTNSSFKIPFNDDIFRAEGNSMFPTIQNNQTVELDKNKIPGKNDVIVFTFLRADSPEILAVYTDKTFLKRIIDINENSCYWVEGDNRDYSLDSRSFGWLCPNNIKINGIVIGK